LEGTRTEIVSPIIELRDLCKSYWQDNLEINILKRSILKFYPGEFLAIMVLPGPGKALS
jgi:ABC-type lipoprotein export system ATPase subunit